MCYTVDNVTEYETERFFFTFLTNWKIFFGFWDKFFFSRTDSNVFGLCTNMYVHERLYYVPDTKKWVN